MRIIATCVAAGLFAGLLGGCATAQAQSQQRLELTSCRPGGFQEDVLCGVFNVPENRAAPNGRMLPLKVIVLRAREDVGAGPVFFLSGGPGQAATQAARFIAASSWVQEHHDVVFVDLRGTGEGHRLDCVSGATDEDLQSYLQPVFSNVEAYAACRDELSQRADLTQYTTEISMRDLDEARQALGYDEINLMGGSYGTRAALVYIRNHGEHVRSAFLSGAAPLENRNPLYHAPSAQRAFERVADQCAADAACHAAFPDVRGDLNAVLTQLRARPARVTVSHPATGAPTEVTVSDLNFADALRVMMYSATSSRTVPYLLSRARQGDVTPFAQTAVRSSRGLLGGLRLGLLLSVTCGEDTVRIRPEEIATMTAGTYLGDTRVRNQMRVCEIWPRGALSPDHAATFTSDVPTVIVSGEIDPVTPPPDGEMMRRYFTNSLHVLHPGSHAVEDEACLDASIGSQLFLRGTVDGIDTSCVAAMTLPPFVTTDEQFARLQG